MNTFEVNKTKSITKPSNVRILRGKRSKGRRRTNKKREASSFSSLSPVNTSHVGYIRNKSNNQVKITKKIN